MRLGAKNMYLNKAFVIGNLTRDPEIKALPGGTKVCTFSVATNRVWKDKTGAKKEEVDYHNIVVFNRPAETSAQYLKKGSTVMIEGRMQTRSWDTADGQKKYRTEIVADRVQFGNRPGGAATGSTTPSSKSVSEDPTAKDAPPVDTIEYPEEEINAEDIPF